MIVTGKVERNSGGDFLVTPTNVPELDADDLVVSDQDLDTATAFFTERAIAKFGPETEVVFSSIQLGAGALHGKP